MCSVIEPDIASPADAVCADVAFVINVPGAAGIVAVILATPPETEAEVPLNLTPVKVPVFFVKPHPLTVVCVGISDICATTSVSIEIVPVVVIGPPISPVPVAILVTVPEGSSPEGINVQELPFDIKVSPAFAAID